MTEMFINQNTNILFTSAWLPIATRTTTADTGKPWNSTFHNARFVNRPFNRYHVRIGFHIPGICIKNILLTFYTISIPGHAFSYFLLYKKKAAPAIMQLQFSNHRTTLAFTI